MAQLINLPTFSDERGDLTVIENTLPFKIKRIYYIYNVSSKRGCHRHKKTIQALICLNGKCDIYINNGIYQATFLLDSPKKCLIIYPEDWHTMDNFSEDSILLVLSSELYDKEDYIHDKY